MNESNLNEKWTDCHTEHEWGTERITIKNGLCLMYRYSMCADSLNICSINHTYIWIAKRSRSYKILQMLIIVTVTENRAEQLASEVKFPCIFSIDIIKHCLARNYKLIWTNITVSILQCHV